MLDFISPDRHDGLYVQYRVFRFSKGANIPVTTFWSDGAPAALRADRMYFYSPALRPYGKSTVLGSFCVWLDFDDLEDWRVLPYRVFPSLVVSTGGGYHVYWRVDEFLDFDTLSAMLRRLLVLYPSADPMCIDPTRFLRWPGSKNLKYDPPRLCEIVHRSDAVYSRGVLWTI